MGDYNLQIQAEGGNAFNSLYGIIFTPSRSTPIKVYLFGSGAFVAVFKGFYNGKNYAIRCFLSVEDETMYRHKLICDYLKEVNASWKTDSEFIENEIWVNGNSFPILKMEWLNGLLINQFVTKNLADNNVLSELQKKLVTVSKDLEYFEIGHGDLQCGNIIIIGTSSNFQVKLIDYDGMYVPALINRNSIEKGRSEFQHPKRSKFNFSPEMDRFSIWVMITAIEALKIDKTLWSEVMQGGFNTLDNFLFTIQDFINPNQSILFKRLFSLKSTSLNFYLERLKMICYSDYSAIPPPSLYCKSFNLDKSNIENHEIISTESKTIERTVSDNKYKIISTNGIVFVRSSTFQNLGSTPLELDKTIYSGKLILVSNGRETKQVTLNPLQNLIEVDFD